MNQKEIEVPMFEWRRVEYPDILKSGGLEPCIAIGLYDPETRSGYGYHYIPGSRYTELRKMIASARNVYHDLSGLAVFIGGNSLDSDEDADSLESSLAERLRIRKLLGRYFKDSQIQVRWLPNDSSGELFLDTMAGEFRFEVD
jgi:hypothetical protein